MFSSLHASIQLEDGSLVRSIPSNYTGKVFNRTSLSTEYYFEGNLHRIEAPAEERQDGSALWYQHGKRHRIGGPAVTYPNGDKHWWFKNRFHRTDGHARYFVYTDTKDYWLLHRHISSTSLILVVLL